MTVGRHGLIRIAKSDMIKDTWKYFNMQTDAIERQIDSLENEIEELRKQARRSRPQPIEIEGGGSTWWYVCPECHGQMGREDRFCRHCGQALGNDI